MPTLNFGWTDIMSEINAWLNTPLMGGMIIFTFALAIGSYFGEQIIGVFTALRGGSPFRKRKDKDSSSEIQSSSTDLS